jgi:hypothetical protein
MRDETRFRAELWWYFFGLLPVTIVTLAWTATENQAMPQRIFLIAIGAAIGGLALYSVGEAIRPTEATAQSGNNKGRGNQNSIGSILNNQGIVTQGQIGGTNLVVARPLPRAIDDNFKQFVRANLKDKTKHVVPMVLSGDDEPERTAFSIQIEEFLRTEGFTVRPRVYFLSPGGTPQGVIMETETDPSAVIIKVGVNNRT